MLGNDEMTAAAWPENRRTNSDAAYPVADPGNT